MLPEYFCIMGRSDRDKLAVAEAPGDGPIQAMLAETAREHRLWLVGGTLPLRSGEDGAGDQRQARLLARLASRSRATTRSTSSATTTGASSTTRAARCRAGAEPVAFDAARRLRVGLSVCYDLRFPELYRALMQPPCDLLCVPSAFTHPTGLAHWEVLLRARAIENQCYVVAAAQGGLHENGRRTFGHSLIVDPWGEIVAMLPEGEGIVAGEVRRERIAEVRTQLPALEHRRRL